MIDDDVPLQPSQFRLRGILLAVTSCCAALAIVRYVPPPIGITLPELLHVAAVLCGITALIYSIVQYGYELGPLFGAAIGTVGGGSAFGALTIGYLGVPFEGFPFMMISMIVGALWAGFFLVGGLGVAYVFDRLRGQSDAWTGVVCGVTTGFLTLFFLDEFNVETWPARLFFCSLPAIVGGAFGGFGSLVSIAGARWPLRRRTMPPRSDD